MRKSLSLKMLFLTFGSFLILISVIFASLYIYFDKFYEPQTIDHMIKAINNFSDSFKENSWSNDELYSEVSKFMKKENATMSIKPDFQHGNIYRSLDNRSLKPVPDFFVLKSGLINGSINNMPISDYILKNLVPNIGVVMKKSPVPQLVLTFSRDAGYESGTTTVINGAIVLYPDKEAFTVGFGGQIKANNKDGVVYTISGIPYTNYKQVNFTKQIDLGNGKHTVTNVRLSLQTASEVMDFLLRFFPFLMAAAILLSIIMALVYSKTISKPIVSITGTADRMAGMELGIVSKVNRKDELGRLSSSLNTLSSNLKNALDDLSQANEKLKEDYENELKQEKARKEFVANVSHELKTPLGIIKSYTEGIRDGVKTEKKDYYMEVILNEITHMDKLILEMLEISKFDAGAVKYNKKSVEIDSLIEKSAEIFIAKADEKDVTIEVTGQFGDCLIDEEKIERVINNLLCNAVKYCNPCSVITIHGDRSEECLTVKIENDCPRFEEEVLTKIWDRFYKADLSHNREADGTGLGLAITKSILEGHGSEYGVCNTKRGLCFFFTLELA